MFKDIQYVNVIFLRYGMNQPFSDLLIKSTVKYTLYIEIFCQTKELTKKSSITFSQQNIDIKNFCLLFNIFAKFWIIMRWTSVGISTSTDKILGLIIVLKKRLNRNNAKVYYYRNLYFVYWIMSFYELFIHTYNDIYIFKSR